MVKLEMISGPFQAILFAVIAWNPETNCRAERRIISHSTEIYWRDKGYKYIHGCNVGEKHRRPLERSWRSRIVRYVDRFHKTHRF